MPRWPKTKERLIADKTLIVDNGAYQIKAGFAHSEPDTSTQCVQIPNCLARIRGGKVWVGAQLDKCGDFREMSFRRPVERGYLVNWEAEREIWEDSFFNAKAKLKCDPHATNLILTEAPNTPQVLQSNADQIVFEEFEFAAYYRCIGSTLNAYDQLHSSQPTEPKAEIDDTISVQPADCLLVIDSGYSHTTITPVLRGRPVHPAIRRLDIGGKFLTNFLKELVSIRSYDMIEETHIMNEMKEKISYVSDNFAEDLERTWKGNGGGAGEKRKAVIEREWNPRTKRKDIVTETGRRGILVDYVLPDPDKNVSGVMRPHDPLQALKLKRSMLAGGQDVEAFITVGNERFAGPELLFHPGDVGMNQKGIPELVLECLDVLPVGLRPGMLANIKLVGGNANIEGFVERLQTDLRKIIPEGYPLRVVKPADPVKSTWLGGAKLCSNIELLKSVLVTREEYQEHGATWLSKKFQGRV